MSHEPNRGPWIVGAVVLVALAIIAAVGKVKIRARSHWGDEIEISHDEVAPASRPGIGR